MSEKRNCSNCGVVETTYWNENTLSCGYCGRPLPKSEKEEIVNKESEEVQMNKNMSKEESIRKIFDDHEWELKSLQKSHVIGRGIPSELLKNAVIENKLPSRAKIYLLIETDDSILIPDNDYTVFTDEGISINDVETFEGEPIFYKYADIESVEYSNGIFIFKLEDDSEDEIGDHFFVPEESQRRSYSKTIVEIINKLAKLFVNEDNMYRDELEKFSEEKEFQKVIEITQKYLMANGNDAAFSSYSYFKKAEAEFFLEQYENSLDSLNIALDSIEKDHPLNLRIRYLESQIYYCLGDSKVACQSLLIASNSTEDKNQKNAIEKEYFEIYDEFLKEFSELEREDRKLIFIDDSIEYISDYYCTFLKRSYPEGLVFPVGHPIENQFYMLHPYIENQYIPLQHYENILFQDKVRELCYILQCLGATSIEIESLKGNSVESIQNSSLNFSGGASFKIHSGSVSTSQNINSESYRNQLSQLSTKQKFTPTKKPYLPESLIWFSHETEWQQVYQQRMNGNLNSFSLVLRNQFSNLNKKNTLTKIKAEYENLIIKLKGGFSQGFESQFSEDGFTEWKLEVHFAPVSELNDDTQKLEAKPTSSNFTKPEEDYMELVEDAYEDNQISSDERKLLDKKLEKLGIPKNRASELEQIVFQKVLKLSEKEQEYLELYQDSFEDKLISEDEKKLLNKRREKFGITPERAKEIAAFVERDKK
ncbi:MAG: hypothetical protein SFU98_03475 [Leptospiraceae bacterium]|nr:hypothetical protein [Leptospiraceae bacterium]